MAERDLIINVKECIITLTTEAYSKIVPIGSFIYSLDHLGLHIIKAGASDILIPHNTVKEYNGQDFENGKLLTIFNDIANVLDKLCKCDGGTTPEGKGIFTKHFTKEFV